MASAYKLFNVNQQAEQAGVLMNYGDFRLRIARAGGSNAKFRRLLTAKLKPYRHQLDNDTMDDNVSEQLLKEAYAEVVILGWESRVVKDGVETWEPWLDTPHGKLKYSADNCIKVLNDLPELFRDIQSMASKVATFRADEEEEAVKN
jgi:hypothetical protein